MKFEANAKLEWVRPGRWAVRLYRDILPREMRRRWLVKPEVQKERDAGWSRITIWWACRRLQLGFEWIYMRQLGDV